MNDVMVHLSSRNQSASKREKFSLCSRIASDVFQLLWKWL